MKRCAVLLMLALAGCSDEPPLIYKWDAKFTSSWSTDKAHQFVIRNPPKGQGALVELIRSYLENTPPPGFWDGDNGAIFYRESSATPIDERQRPKASWWDQSWDVPYIKHKPIDDQVIVGAGYMKSKKSLRISFHGDYDRTCKANDFAIVDIQADGSRDPTCD